MTTTTPNPPVDGCSCCTPLIKHIRTSSTVVVERPWVVDLASCYVCDNHWHRPDRDKNAWVHVSATTAKAMIADDRNQCVTLRGAINVLHIEALEPTSEEVDNVLKFVQPPAA